MKSKKVYVCSNCGAQHPKWMGQCSSCGEWNTLEEEVVVAKQKAASKAMLASQVSVGKLGDADQKTRKRYSTGFAEVDTVLGGGIVADQVTLLSGEPGIGKSTLLLQIAVQLAASDLEVIYASGEESLAQVGGRAARLYKEGQYEQIEFIGSPGVNSLIQQMQDKRPDFLVVDSIQTMYDESLTSLPGSLTQVKASTAALVSAAKQIGVAVVLVGHINKDGNIAGPKVLEHLVDTVLQFEGERSGEYRILRGIKNRFGPTGEVGLLVMAENGLRDMDPSLNVFDNEDSGAGLARTLVVEGNRPLIIQVQALVNPTVFAYPKRVAEGVSVARLQLITAILNRFAGAQLGDKDVYVRTTGGYRLSDTSSDLAIAAAILSSLKNKEISANTAYVGELSLSGGITLPANIRSNLKDLAKYGIKNLVSPSEIKVSKLSSVRVSKVSKLL